MPTPTPSQKVELEFAGLIVQPVIQRRVDGRLAGETVNDPLPARIFDGEAAAALIAEIEKQTFEINAATNPSRAVRRSRSRK